MFSVCLFMGGEPPGPVSGPVLGGPSGPASGLV